MIDLDNSKNENQKEIPSQGNVDKYEIASKIFTDIDFIFFEAIEKSSNQKFLVKKLRQSADSLLKLKNFIKEAEFLSSFDSPFIIKYVNFDASKSTLITEYPPNRTLQNLFDEASHSNDLGWDETNKLMLIYGIASGMAHVHSKGIIHGDLTSENIFLDDYLLPKIHNFYRSHFSKNEDYTDFISDIFNQALNVGTEIFIAPELLLDDEYDQSIDVFSFAKIVYMIITGKKPRLSPFQLTNGTPINFDKNTPQAYRKLIESCMSKDPKKRPTFQEIVSSLRTDQGFITNNVDKQKFLEFVDSKKTKFNFKKFNIKFSTAQELLIETEPIDLSIFKKIQYIGQGQFGEVYKVENKKTSKIFSAKINKRELDEISEAEKINLTQEINILSKFDSPLILKLIGYNQKNFENDQFPTIITDFCINDSLDKIIELQKLGLSPPKWNDTQILINVYGIAAGMAYIHSKNILHRDIKPGNVFMDEFLFPKIGDFGLSIKLSDDSSFEAYNIVGTPSFISPEIYTSSKYTKAGDVYAYGILLYQLITLQTPFEGYSFYKIICDVPKGIRPSFKFEIPTCYKNLIERCWDNDPDKRPSFEDIVDLLENNSEFITELIDTEEFFNYIDYVKDAQTNNSFQPVTIDFDELKRMQSKNQQLNVPYLDLNNF
ncbi:hypothetical protein M9Y10_018679 [Tritrichomonas musculus]|uniref:Protein kinase domain-containing protein n=1 Tax=Tritrichomonas musculus TaxID=1915356 RepID=A0ABR2GMQ9_9EUKA